MGTDFRKQSLLMDVICQRGGESVSPAVGTRRQALRNITLRIRIVSHVKHKKKRNRYPTNVKRPSWPAFAQEEEDNALDPS